MLNVTVTRSHSESGSIVGTAGKSNKKFDLSWNSHELWINGRMNPEDHPLEGHAEHIFDVCETRLVKMGVAVEKGETPFVAHIKNNKIVKITALTEDSTKADWEAAELV